MNQSQLMIAGISYIFIDSKLKDPAYPYVIKNAYWWLLRGLEKMEMLYMLAVKSKD